MIVFGMVWTAPATLVDYAMDTLSSGRVRVVSTDGNLWTGSGQLEIRNSVGAAVYAGSLDWSVSKSSVLLGQLVIHYHLFDQPLTGAAQLSFASLLLTDIQLDLPAAAVMALIPAIEGYGVGGTLTIASQSLQFTRESTLGDAELRWQDASSALAPVAPLGSYQLHLVGDAAPVQFNAQLTTLQGPLQLDGGSTLGINERPSMQVNAALPDSAYAELAPFMRLIGVESPGGRFLIDI
jgi:general secretion pathway protein N